MFRILVSCILLAAGCGSLSASIISISASCADPLKIPTAFDNNSAVCSGTGASAFASAGNEFWVTATATYTDNGTPLWSESRAEASSDVDYMLTIHGSTGTGWFTPCLSISYSDSGRISGSGEWATASFGSFTVSGGAGNGGSESCFSGVSIPLQFDTATLFHIHLSATAYADSSWPHDAGASATARFTGVRVVDASSARIEGASYVLTAMDPLDVPEPSYAILLAITGAGLFAFRIKRRQRRRLS